jgi:hypothetical protein
MDRRFQIVKCPLNMAQSVRLPFIFIFMELMDFKNLSLIPKHRDSYWVSFLAYPNFFGPKDLLFLVPKHTDRLVVSFGEVKFAL